MTDRSTGSIEATPIPEDIPRSPYLPPRWFVRTAWLLHRALYRVTGGRRGLWPPKPGKWGTMRLFTVGRRSGRERVAILGYFEDGPNLVTLAMNGWTEGEPAWWLNMQAQPDVTIELTGADSRAFHAPRRRGRGAGPPLGAVAHLRPRSSRRLRHAAIGDGRRRPRAAAIRLTGSRQAPFCASGPGALDLAAARLTLPGVPRRLISDEFTRISRTFP